VARRNAVAKTNGVGQLSLVEHALCPLDTRRSLMPNQVFQSGYFYSDQYRKRKRASVKVYCPLGLSPQDELNLWGMLALTLANKDSDGSLFATRYYILSQMGIINSKGKRGGRQYTEFEASLQRLSMVTYRNDGFYDAVRAEHRKVSFGFLSFSAPEDDRSDRPWRIAWDPVFFDLVKPIGGALRFNFELYSEMDFASRRLFLFMAKIFRRRTTTPRLTLKELAIGILGYSPKVEPRNLRVKVNRTIKRLEEIGILAKHEDHILRKKNDTYSVLLHRGRDYFKLSDSQPKVVSPLVDPLKSIGFNNAAIRSLLANFPLRLLNQWVDITLAAKERFGMSYFSRSPAAYLRDNLNHASKGNRLPPDWWHDIRRAEERARAKASREKRLESKPNKQASMPEKAISTFDELSSSIFDHFLSGGQSEEIAKANSKRFRDAAQKRK